VRLKLAGTSKLRVRFGGQTSRTFTVRIG
jgi:hypothetical protein